MNLRIPKRIIQTDKSLDLPLISKAAVANVRLLNPDFEYFFFDDIQVEEFIDTQFPEYRQIFHSFPIPIQRYDFFRYLAVYHFGGFYFDTDVFLVSSLSNLLDFGCVFPFEGLSASSFLLEEYGMDWEIGNYAFGAAAGHPFIQAVIKNCIRAQKDKEWEQEMMRGISRMIREEFIALYTSGPGLVSRTLAEYQDAAKQVKVLFPENVCDPTKWSLFGEYGVHLKVGKWRKQKGSFLRRLVSVLMRWKDKQIIRKGLERGEQRSLKFKL